MMTEAEWLACVDPVALIDKVAKSQRANQRVMRLFVTAFWHWQSYQLSFQPNGELIREDMQVLQEWAESGTPPLDLESRRARRTLFFRASATRAARETAAAPNLWGNQKPAATAQLLALIHELFGNPFRKVRFNPAWRTSTVVGLATGIYEDRAFDRMPILADALQDAGCEVESILAHCRSESPHVRGCWVVDLILKK